MEVAAFEDAVTNALAPGTRAGYRRILTEFLAYADRRALGLTSGDALMAAVAGFVGKKIRAGYAAAAGRQLYAALCIHFPAWAGSLRPLARGLRGWEKARPIVKRQPLVRPLAVAMAMRLVVWGHPSAAVALLLGFHAYLRVGELLRVEPWHVVAARDARTGRANRYAFLHIPWAKTGTQQDVELTDDDIVWLVGLAARVALAGRSAPARGTAAVRVFALREHAFRKLFAACAASYGLPPEVVPHSLRHGGATCDYASGRRSAEEIRIRGRWKSTKSMNHYVGQMRSALANLQVPAASVACGAALEDRVRWAFTRLLARAAATPEVAAFRAALAGREDETAATPPVAAV